MTGLQVELFVFAERLRQLFVEPGQAVVEFILHAVCRMTFGEKFIRDIERRHHGDTIQAKDFAGVANGVHLLIEIAG